STELLFGLGSAAGSIKKIEVSWPGGGITVLNEVSSNQLIDIQQPAASAPVVSAATLPKRFTDITASSGLLFTHKENDFVDFKDEVLLPYQLSRQGPALAAADVNGDGLKDVYLGGAIGQSGSLYLQTNNNTWIAATQQPWMADSSSEQVNALFFDADGDGDADLYTVSGGNEYADNAPEYADHLYLNDGKGNFKKAMDALPPMLNSKQAIAVADMDNDGDLDIFIGGKSIPGSFPLAANSYLLRNDSKGGTVRFTDVTEALAPMLRKPGMVNVAAWCDLNNDHYPELLIAGDWMPLMLIYNNKGSFKEISAAAGLNNTSGMWSAITPADVDGDGDIDFLLGNAGINNQFTASVTAPMTMYVADFDDNGSIDPIICYYINGRAYPMASRDELLDQLVPLRKKFVKYIDYADATLENIFSKEQLAKAQQFKCEQLASGILYNQGGGRFSFEALPLEAQFSKVNSLLVDDFNNDNVPDIFAAGNFYPYRIQLGRCDASLGQLLAGTNNRKWVSEDPALTGAYADGDVRGVVEVKNKQGDRLLIISKNDGPVQVLQLNKQ
ncbi:MAG TPA: FG-GAP-like repeat-containing protein, partial [Chitinophagaceae bacterium]|nr:FG-GAP-like repeat-containing protein [Chitinophagaceae bacterium]